MPELLAMSDYALLYIGVKVYAFVMLGATSLYVLWAIFVKRDRPCQRDDRTT